jgi:ribosome-binding protein aMBF1 (putative translation factor)
MTKEDQVKFYALVGRALQVARQRRNMSIAQLSTKTGEHHGTIRSIEAGKPHSLHHAVWMKNILGIDINTIIKDMEGNNGQGNDRGVSLKDFI